jgi:hypothetical protein
MEKNLHFVHITRYPTSLMAVFGYLKGSVMPCISEFVRYSAIKGARGGAEVEALRYKPEGRGIDCRWCHWNFSLT